MPVVKNVSQAGCKNVEPSVWDAEKKAGGRLASCADIMVLLQAGPQGCQDQRSSQSHGAVDLHPTGTSLHKNAEGMRFRCAKGSGGLAGHEEDAVCGAQRHKLQVGHTKARMHL